MKKRYEDTCAGWLISTHAQWVWVASGVIPWAPHVLPSAPHMYLSVHHVYFQVETWVLHDAPLVLSMATWLYLSMHCKYFQVQHQSNFKCTLHAWTCIIVLKVQKNSVKLINMISNFINLHARNTTVKPHTIWEIDRKYNFWFQYLFRKKNAKTYLCRLTYPIFFVMSWLLFSSRQVELHCMSHEELESNTWRKVGA